MSCTVAARCLWSLTLPLPLHGSCLSIDVEDVHSALTVIRDGTAAAMRYGLTACDAAYLDLAAREGLTLATLDKAMRKAAEQSGIAVFQQR